MTDRERFEAVSKVLLRLSKEHDRAVDAGFSPAACVEFTTRAGSTICRGLFDYLPPEEVRRVAVITPMPESGELLFRVTVAGKVIAWNVEAEDLEDELESLDAQRAYLEGMCP